MMSAETLPWFELSAPRLDTQLATPWTANEIEQCETIALSTNASRNRSEFRTVPRLCA